MGKDATFSANDFTTDGNALKFDKEAISGFTSNLKEFGAAQGVMQGAFKAALEEGAKSLTNKGTLPACEIGCEANQNGMVDALNRALLRDKLINIDGPKIDLKKVGEMVENERNASKAADIVLGSDPHGRDLGNEAEQKELQRIFHEAHEKGPEAVQKLVDAINKRLEGSGMRVDFDESNEPFSLSDGRLKVVNEHNQIIKSLNIPDPDSIYRRGAL